MVLGALKLAAATALPYTLPVVGGHHSVGRTTTLHRTFTVGGALTIVTVVGL